MPFAKGRVDAAGVAGAVALDVKLPFNEAALLQENAVYVARSLKVESVRVRSVTYEEQTSFGDDRVAVAAPGAPAALLTH